ncbi:MAG: acyltransferase, partial [Herminiimonas sp.]|nr:acyltransferase [Herminiimonas sp.]
MIPTAIAKAFLLSRYLKTSSKHLLYSRARSVIPQNNNFDVIRLFAALLVLFSHSFPLVDGENRNEPLAILSGGEATFGSVAVYVFFVISGFLVTMSYESTQNVRKFLAKRFLRIYPALIPLLLLTVFVLGPIVTSLSSMEYFLNGRSYNYLNNLRLFKLQYDLPGVFENNPYKSAVNGSLWTLAYECSCYLIVAVLGLIGALKKRHFVLFLFLATFLPLPLNFIHPNVQVLSDLFKYFSGGMLAYLYFDRISFSKKYVFVVLAATVLAMITPQLKFLLVPFGSYLIIKTAFMSFPKLPNVTKYGDLS